MPKDAPTTSVTTGKVRLSFAHIWKPTKGMNDNPDAKKKYEATFLIKKKDKETVNAIYDAIDNAIDLGIKKGLFKDSDVDSKKWNPGLRDGDEEKENDPNYKGCFFLCARSGQRPGIIDKRGKDIEDEEMVYSGCYVRAHINFYPFNSNGSKGIAVGLNHIQFIEDGDTLAGRGNARDAFADYIEEDDDDDDNDRGSRRRSSRDEFDDEKPKSRNRRRDDDDEDEDEKPKSRNRRRDDDDDEDEKPKSRKRRDDDDDEDEKPKSRSRRRDDDDDDEDEKPKSRNRRRDDDDEDDDRGGRRSRR